MVLVLEFRKETCNTFLEEPNMARRFSDCQRKKNCSAPQKAAASAKERESIDQFIQGQPTACSFCGIQATKGHSKFNAISIKSEALICSNCITSYAKKVSLIDMLELDWDGPAAHCLRSKMDSALSGRPGTTKMKSVAASAAFSICRKIAESHNNDKNQSQLRILVKGEDSDTFFDLLKTAVEQTGITALKTTSDDYRQGAAKANLAIDCHNDTMLMRYSVFFVEDGLVPPSPICPIVCVTDSQQATDWEGYDRVELS